MADELRYPLSPVHEPNLLAGSVAVPPPLELPDMVKGENLDGLDVRPRTVSRAGMTPTVSDSPDSLSSPPESRGSFITPIQAPQDVCVRAETSTPSPTEIEQRSPPAEVVQNFEGTPDGPTAVKSEPEVDAAPSDEDEDAVMALLSLQRVASSASLGEWTPPAHVGEKRRASSPALEGRARGSPLPKLSDSGDARFFCRYPGCGKGYASTDAVRKHCRQRHLEWLRRLGHGCPALYCRWGDAN
jgi:hypothetical protein